MFIVTFAVMRINAPGVRLAVAVLPENWGEFYLQAACDATGMAALPIDVSMGDSARVELVGSYYSQLSAELHRLCEKAAKSL